MMKFAGSLNGLEYHSARAAACVRGRRAREGVSSVWSTRTPAERGARDVSASTVCRRPARKIVLAERRAGDTLRARPTQPALFLTPESKAKSNLEGDQRPMYPLNEQETKYQQLLTSANNFTLEELEANRGGRITEGQLAKLKRSLYSSLGCSVLLILIGGFLLVGGIAAALGGSDGLIAGLIMLVIGLVLVPLGLFSVRKGYGDVKEPRLLSYEGIVLQHGEKKNLQGGLAPP